MTCPECGGPLDPDVTHIQHSERCWLAVCLGDEGCDCPEVCANCCSDLGCALRDPQETPDG